MKKIIKTIILFPMWPLIYLQLGATLDPSNCNDRGCWVCGEGDGGCCRRARAMVSWWRS